MGLPISDDYLYETFGIEKPENYDMLKQQKEEERKALRLDLSKQEETQEEKQESQNSSNDNQTTFKQYLKSFFGVAPHQGLSTISTFN